MQYRRLGNSDLEVSEISLGPWLTYGTALGRKQAEACIRQAIELGIDFFDTATCMAGEPHKPSWATCCRRIPEKTICWQQWSTIRCPTRIEDYRASDESKHAACSTLPDGYSGDEGAPHVCRSTFSTITTKTAYYLVSTERQAESIKGLRSRFPVSGFE